MSDISHLVALTEQLIRIRSTNDRPQDIATCMDMVASYFDGTALQIDRVMHEGVPSIVVTNGSKTPKVFLSGHLDVVNGDDDDQFMARLDGDRLYGRGALDMKSGVAVLMAVMKECAATHDIGLMVTGDEETGGFHGTKRLLEQGYACKVAVIPDGGNAVHRVVLKEKGVMRVTLRAHGVAAHSAHLWLGTNAIGRLVDAIGQIQSVFVPVEQHPANHWMTTCNIGHICGGTATNCVPDDAIAECDIRYIETDDPAHIVDQMRRVVPPGVDVEMTMLEPHVFVSRENPFVVAFNDSVVSHGRTPEIGLDHGSSDGRYFTDRGIPVIISQPDGENAHAKNEWVSIAAIETYYDVLKTFLDGVARR